MNPELEKAFRVADFLELGQLMAMDALNRNESCGGHFREEYSTQTEKHREMMRTISMPQFGNTKEKTSIRKSYTKKNWFTRI